MNMLIYSSMSVLGGVIGALCTYLIVKNALKTERILDISDEIIEDLLDKAVSDPKMQQKIYSVGLLLGNGIRQGIGINTKGKKKLDDLLIEGASYLMGSILGGQGKQPTDGVAIPEHLKP